MTLVYEQKVGGPAAHALVIGVGAYPRAKQANAGPGTPKPLRNVADLASAAAGADAFCDWLIGEADLSAPLASVEVLKNGPDEGNDVYSWVQRLHPVNGGADPRPDSAVEEPTSDNVRAAGERWVQRLKSASRTVGILYICGHGVVLSSFPIVFLSDLNGNQAQPWSAFLDVHDAAVGLKQVAEIAAAHIFVDACGEIVSELELEKLGAGAAKFIRSDPQKQGTEKVSLLAAAAPNYRAYEDEGTTGGRFTLTVLRALRGAAARNPTGQPAWVAYPHGIHEDLKNLYRLQPAWRGQVFEPGPPLLPSEVTPIVVYKQPPHVELRVRLDPEAAIEAGDVLIVDSSKCRTPALHTRVKDGTREWKLTIRASIWPHFIIAEFPKETGYSNAEVLFAPSRSLFEQVVRVR